LVASSMMAVTGHLWERLDTTSGLPACKPDPDAA
jgi:hypothetical protein